jgi:hypothetical protein
MKLWMVIYLKTLTLLDTAGITIRGLVLFLLAIVIYLIGIVTGWLIN